LYLEFLKIGIVKDEQGWNRLQVSFLTGHQFHTDFAVNARQPKKKNHLEELQELVAGYDN